MRQSYLSNFSLSLSLSISSQCPIQSKLIFPLYGIINIITRAKSGPKRTWLSCTDLSVPSSLSLSLSPVSFSIFHLFFLSLRLFYSLSFSLPICTFSYIPVQVQTSFLFYFPPFFALCASTHFSIFKSHSFLRLQFLFSLFVCHLFVSLFPIPKFIPPKLI